MHLTIALLSLTLAGADPGKCPISGKPAKEDVSLDVNGKKVNFCCENCPKEFAKRISLTDNGPKNCPLSGKSAKEETKVIHQKAELIGFCCGNCPTKYLEKEKLEVVDKGPKTCAACDKPAVADHALSINGTKTYFCCGACKEEKLKKLDIKADQALANCPLSGKPGKKEHTLVRVKSEAVYFCCNNCRGKYIAQNFEQKGAKKGKYRVD